VLCQAKWNFGYSFITSFVKAKENAVFALVIILLETGKLTTGG